MRKRIPEFDLKSCFCCKICAQICPVSAIRLAEPGKQGKYKNLLPSVDAELCIGCGSCAAECPAKIITMKEI